MRQNTFKIVFYCKFLLRTQRIVFQRKCSVLCDFKLYYCVDLSPDGYTIRLGYDRLLCSIFAQISGCWYVQKM